MRRRSIAFAAAALAAVSVHPLGAQTFPEGTFRIIVPTTPGTTQDVLARAFSTRLSERIGRPVVVENRVGASGNIGTEAVVRASPNGATVLIAASTLATGAKLQALPFNAITDLAPVSLLAWNRLVLVTHPGTGIKSTHEWIAAARKSPGKLTYGSPGNGTPNHLAAELFKVRTRTYVLHVPYRGTAQQITDILAGQIDMAPLTIGAAAPHVRSGRLVPLAVIGTKRSSLLSGVPSLAEQGLPDIDGSIWYGMFAPRGTPPELVARLNAIVRELLQENEANLRAQGIEAEGSTQEALAQLLSRDTARWADVIQTQHIKAE